MKSDFERLWAQQGPAWGRRSFVQQIKKGGFMKYSYAQEKITNATYILSFLGEGTNAPDRLAGALSELTYAKDEVYGDQQAKVLYDEIFSMIDYAKIDKEKGIYKKNFEEMNKELLMYIGELIFKIHFRIEDLYYKTNKIEKGEDPNVKAWKENIRKTYAQFQKEASTK